MQVTLKEYLHQKQKLIEEGLERYLPQDTPEFPFIHSAMRYSVFAGGKRLRPILSLLSAEVCNGSLENILPAACALEMIHTYSLIHDDLPAMDDDDFRRGKPSNHKQFGEAIAILAGDALLTLAFYIIATSTAHKNYIAPLIEELAYASGTSGMVGGQVLDILSEGKSYEMPQLERIHLCKTAALIQAATRMGAIASGADQALVNQLGTYGKHLGLAFQIQDDILDIQGSLEELGKTPQKDQAQGKLTYPALVGLEEAKKMAHKQAQLAIKSLALLPNTKVLIDLTEYVVHRKS
ncbi:MAG: polyprenyl synthetase family protein [Planctomycetota bacterium]